MNKIDKYLRRFAYKIETSETKESRYYTIGDLIVRVSNHIGKNSSGNISIIIDRSNYILYVPSTNKVSLISYEECKTLIKGIVLHASLFLTGDVSYQRNLIKENEELKFQIKGLKQGMETLEKQLEKKAVSEEKSTSIQEIKTTLQNLTKGQKKRIKSIYGSCVFHSMPDAILRAVWKNSEIQKWIQQNKPNYI